MAIKNINTENDADHKALPQLAFSLREAAKIIGISYLSAYRLNRRGLLKSSPALRHKIIPLAEIQRFLSTVV